MVAPWWRHGGGIVAAWWRRGGVMVAAWWRHGGGMVALVDAPVPIISYTAQRNNQRKSQSR